MMRILIALFCSLLVAACVKAQTTPEAGESEESGCGVERWSIKDLSDSAAKQINFIPLMRNVSQLVSLPTLDPSSYAPRDTSEMHSYRVVCYIKQFKLESDGDVHLVIEDTANTAVTMIAEIPDSSCPDAIAGGDAPSFAAARRSLFTIAGKLPDSSFFTYLDPAPLVVLTGIGYYDPPHGQTGKAPNNLEIHPVLSLSAYTPSAVEDITSMPTNVTLQSTPMPFSSRVSIAYAMQHTGNAQIAIYNVFGERVFERLLPAAQPSGMLAVNTSGFRPGIYFVILQGGGVTVREKIICVK